MNRRAAKPANPKESMRGHNDDSRRSRPPVRIRNGDSVRYGSPEPVTSLTRREWQVLDLQAQGLRYKEIADRLRISPSTVNNHLAKIREKYHASNLTEVINRAYGPRGDKRHEM